MSELFQQHDILEPDDIADYETPVDLDTLELEFQDDWTASKESRAIVKKDNGQHVEYATYSFEIAYWGKEHLTKFHMQAMALGYRSVMSSFVEPGKKPRLYVFLERPISTEKLPTADKIRSPH